MKTIILEIITFNIICSGRLQILNEFKVDQTADKLVNPILNKKRFCQTVINLFTWSWFNHFKCKILHDVLQTM